MKWSKLELNTDQSVSAALQCAPGEGLDGDGGLSDHEKQLSDHYHAVGLLDHQSSLGVAQGQSQPATNMTKMTFKCSTFHLKFWNKHRQITQSFLPPSSPSGQSSSPVSLYGDSRPADPGVSGPGQPSSDAALDDHGSNTQLLSP